MTEQEIEDYFEKNKPVVFHKHKYVIREVNEINQTVMLQRISVVGLDMSDITKSNIPFDEVEV